MKNLIAIALVAGVLTIAGRVNAQALPTATGRGALQLGGGYTFAKPDFGQKNIQGGSGFADFDLGLHWGAEADIHYVSLITPLDVAENSYLVGPRFIYPRGRFKLYAKGLIGAGHLVIQETQDNPGFSTGLDFAYALGGGLDIDVKRHLVVRAIDFEYQHWNYLTGLTPTVFTVGVAYRFR